MNQQKVWLSPEGKKCLQQGASSVNHLCLLEQQNLLEDAITYSCFSLPYHQALQMTLEFRQYVLSLQQVEHHHPLIQQIEQWRATKEDADRLELFEQSQLFDFATAEPHMALSVFFSTGSLAPLDITEVYPPETLAYQMLGISHLLLIHQSTAKYHQQSQRHFYQLAQRFLALPCEIEQTMQHYLYS